MKITRKIMENQTETCPLCRNHCPVNDLGCDRGRKYQAEKAESMAGFSSSHETEQLGGEKEASREERLMNLFYQGAHLVYHRGGHTRGQGRILHFLHHHGAMTQRELQEYAGIKSASLSELLEKAESNGFLSRFRNSGDKRTVNVSLTELGKSNARDFDKEKGETDKSSFSCLTDEEQEQLESLLSKLVSFWNKTLDVEPCGGGWGRMHKHRMHRHGSWGEA